MSLEAKGKPCRCDPIITGLKEQRHIRKKLSEMTSCPQLLFSKMTVGPMMSRVRTAYKTFVPSSLSFLSWYKYLIYSHLCICPWRESPKLIIIMAWSLNPHVTLNPSEVSKNMASKKTTGPSIIGEVWVEFLPWIRILLNCTENKRFDSDIFILQ